MCTRYVLLQEHAKSLLEQLGALLGANALPPTRYNIAPGGRIPVIRRCPRTTGQQAQSNPIGYSPPGPTRDFNRKTPSEPPAMSNLIGYFGSGGECEWGGLFWGLTPAWARDATSPVVNARAESLAEKPTFRDALRSRRCLIPASGFYEWKVAGRAREPWLFRLRDEQPFAFAGLWETWRSPDGVEHDSCALVTTAPNALMEPVHHRMPALLTDRAAWEAWLDPRTTSLDALAPLLRPLRVEAMTAIAVSPHVNNSRNDDLECLAPAREQQLGFGL